MRNVEAPESAYAAGFFDGEGTVHVGVGAVQVVFTNTNLTLLRWVQRRWGGAIYKQTPHGLANTAHQVYSLRLNGHQEKTDLLRDMEPFLVAKGALVQNALLWLDLKRRWSGKPPPAVAKEFARFAQRHRELRGAAPEPELPDVKDSDQLTIFKAD